MVYEQPSLRSNQIMQNRQKPKFTKNSFLTLFPHPSYLYACLHPYACHMQKASNFPGYITWVAISHL
jgi:hypothetical protein